MRNSETSQIAKDWAEKTFHDFLLYINNKDINIGRDNIKLFSDLIDLEWFDHFPLCQDDSEEKTRLLLTIIRYLYMQELGENITKDFNISKNSMEKMKKDFEKIE